jgi:hypothetical protein
MRRPILIVVLLVGMASSEAFTRGPKFYPDDPIAREPESQDASRAAESEIELFFEYPYNLFA